MIYALDVEKKLDHLQLPAYAYWDGGFTEDELKNIDDIFVNITTHQAKIGNGAGITNTDTRRTDVGFVERGQRSSWVYDKLKKIVVDLNDQYYKFDLTSFEPLQFGIYRDSEKGYYNWHTDSPLSLYVDKIRKLSVIMFMQNSSMFGGGKLLLNVGNEIEVEQKRGRVIVFPSYVLHTVTPVTRGTRRSIVTWCSGPLFK